MKHYFIVSRPPIAAMATPVRRSLSFVTALAVACVQVAIPPRVEAAPLGSSTASAGSATPPTAAAIHSFQPDLFTGRATTAIPIAVPPGRKGIQPSLALAYSSSGKNSWVGAGWSLDVGYIERSTKNGVPKYDASDTFTFMFQGVASDLVKIPGGTYRAKDEGLFLRFENKGVSGWEIRDKSGTRYLFGQTAASQVENGGNVFRWCLDQVLDPDGNSLAMTYTKDQGQLYLSQIRYTAHEPTGLAAANQVDFILENRPDVDVSFRANIETRTAKRLKTIEAKATVGGTLSLARRYTLSYTQSQRTGRSLLRSVTQVGSDGTTSVPPTVFTYQDTDTTSYTVSSNNPAATAPAWNARYANVNLGNDVWGPAHPYLSFPWSASQVVQGPGSINLSCVTVSVGSDGSLQLRGCQDNYVHVWTWVYVNQAKAVSLNVSKIDCDSDASLWLEDAGGIRQVPSGSVSLAAGWSTIHMTDYHEHDCFSSQLMPGLKSQVDIMSASQFLKPQLAGDVDGNGITDLITFDAVAGTWTVSCAHGCAFASGSTWLPGFGGISSIPLLGDWNADGRTDIGIYSGGSWQFATSTGTSFQTGTISSLSFGSGTPLTGDFNGDGQLDVGTYSGGNWQIALNTGSGFSSAGSFTVNLSGSAPMTGDFNGDGLTDIGVVQSNGDISVRLSTGSGWAAPVTWITAFGAGSEHTSADFNGDGLTDAAFYDKATGQVRYAFSTGTAFGAVVTLPVTFAQRSTDDSVQVGDFNGDGLADPAVVNAVSGNAQLAFSTGTMPDLLIGIANGIGGSTAIEYLPSTQCDNVCPVALVPVLPFILPLVRRVTVSDGLGNSYSTAYRYIKGRYDPPSREFRGFGHVEIQDADGNIAGTNFLQDEHTKGRPSGTEFRDAGGNLWTKTAQTWTCIEPYPGVHFAKLDQTDAFTYDGNATFKHTRSRVEYDAYGNVTATHDDGEPTVTGDERSSLTTLTYNPTMWILNKPRLTQTLDANGVVVAQRRFSYDGAADTATAPTKGHLTKEEEWLNLPTQQWLATALTYDTYGNVATVTDALNRTTTNTYDANGTYLITIANALGQTRQLVYDPRFGQVTSSTDQNGITTTTEYDALGRVTKVIGPNDTAALPTASYEYDLSSVPSRTIVHTRIASGQAAELLSYSFADGLGRTIQTRGPAEDPTKQIVGGATELNARGLVIKQWVPYLDAASTSYVPRSLVSGLTSPVLYTYDPLGRALTTTDPDGSVSSIAYDDWTVTGTDANGHQTRRTNDAAGRLATVEEFNNGQTYTTTYQYDALNNLTKVIDANGNVTTIAYDSLGRKLSMDDPDMRHWTYAYDAVDNLTSQTDARGVITAFVYDALNRLTQKSYTIPPTSDVRPQTSVTYTYDGVNDTTKPFTKGKLTKIADGSGSSLFEYDNLGRLTKESKTIDSTTYTIQRAYDLVGRLTSLTYPDNEQALYTYNAQGGIETVALQSPVSGLQSLVSNIDYNAAGQLTKIVYGNGTSTDYSYNPLTLRLDHLQTAGPSGTLQDFRYTFDAIGNVAEIQDTVHTAGQTFEYDGLSRLTKAVGAYGALTYAYDPIGNMLEKEGVTMTYGENGAGAHAVTSATSTQQPALSLTYDANGNMVEKNPCPSSPAPCLTPQTFSYDAENRLVEVKTAQDQTVSVTLKPGWNFFSLPVIPDDGAVTVLLPSFAQQFEQIAKFDAATNTFKHYVGNPTFDDFGALEYGVGYQVYSKSASDVTVSFTGKLPSQALSKSLGASWHLLPSLSLASRVLSLTFGGLDYDQALTFDPAVGSLQPAATLDPGRAYYVHLRTASTFSPSLPRDPTTTFTYDGDGGRVKQLTPAGVTKFLGQSFEIAPDGTTTKYVFAGSQRIASIELAPGQQAGLPQAPRPSLFAKAWDVLGSVMGLIIPDAEAAIAPSAMKFYLTDHLGSSNLITDGAGAVVELAEQTPYGSLARHEGSANVPYKFTGQRSDTATSLYFYNARYYDPQLGRFISADPFVQDPGDPQTLNRYSYVRNNPLNLVDSTGYSFWRTLANIVAQIALAFVTEGASLLYTVPLSLGTYAVTDRIGASIESGYAKSNQQMPSVAFNPSSSFLMPGPGPLGFPTFHAIPGADAGSFLVQAPKSVEEVDAVADQILNISLLSLGVYGVLRGAVGAAGQLTIRRAATKNAAKEAIDVFRVEGYPNTRIHIDRTGNVSVADTTKPLFLNFGQRARAEEFLAQKIRTKLPGAGIKSFQVPRGFLDELRGTAVLESEARRFPNHPFVVDATKAPDQFGLRGPQIKRLLRAIIPGSGKSE